MEISKIKVPGIQDALDIKDSVAREAISNITNNTSQTVMGASGENHAAGLVPDPGAVAGTSKFLREDGTWQTVNIDISGKEDALQIQTFSGTTLTAEVGKYYRATANVGTLAITLPTMDTSVTNPQGLMIMFRTNSSPAVTISSASSQYMKYFSDYAIKASKQYELNCMWNGTEWVIAYGTIG